MEFPLYHDGQLGTESFTLFHAVGSYDDGLASFTHPRNGVPEQAPGPGVHASTWLIQEDS